mmetsp:Transcript_45157/g.115528  ORF Transcript_45157/g.115528 Transcript_45157/m.115528 type:complete len:470 (-) Transcript_45157:58-1467(-)
MATAAITGDAADEAPGGAGPPERLPEDEDSGADADGSEYEDDEEGDDEEGEQYVVLKFLLSTEAAGSVIGKNGATVSELQAQSGTKIQLSKAREFFPGTQERMMLLCGTISQVLVALHLVFTKLLADGVAMLTTSGEGGEGGESEDTDVESAMVVPNRLCGGIIGKGGATIHSFMEDSDAQISVSNIHEATGFGERVIHIRGSRESQLRAVALIATKMTEDRHYSTDEIPLSYPPLGAEGAHTGLMYSAAGAHHHVPYHYAPAHPVAHPHAHAHPAAHYHPHAHPHHSHPAEHGHPMAPAELHHNPHAYHHPHHHDPAMHPEGGGEGGGEEGEAKTYFMLPDEAVGVIIGKQGRTIQSIRQRSGAHVKIEDSQGTGQRLLAVSGPPAAVSIVESMIVTRLQQQGKEAALQRLGASPEMPYGAPAPPAPDGVPAAAAAGGGESPEQDDESQSDSQSDRPTLESVMHALHV